MNGFGTMHYQQSGNRVMVTMDAKELYEYLDTAVTGNAANDEAAKHCSNISSIMERFNDLSPACSCMFFFFCQFLTLPWTSCAGKLIAKVCLVGLEPLPRSFHR